MAVMAEPPSSPPNASTSTEAALAYYKAQYEQLESDLTDFQASSKELEAELEKDVEASEKRERQLKEKADGLTYAVDEWKTKYKQAKAEANTAQNTLQKEVTSLREANRGLQLRLRDIEVQNDDFEKQARNTTSSLEDLESKYNQAIERGVLQEEEIKNGDQERETLRIDVQRLRDELQDLRIEAEITAGKLKKAETTAARVPDHLIASYQLPQSPMTETSPATSASSLRISTPPPKSDTTASTAVTPPSPPLSEQSSDAKPGPQPPAAKPIMAQKVRLSINNDNTPRASQIPNTPRTSRLSRGPTVVAPSARGTPHPAGRNGPRSSIARPSLGANTGLPSLPSSRSLHSIRGLIGQMQRLEQRVHTARSKLPAPTGSPALSSPRNGSVHEGQTTPTAPATQLPSSITVRSGKKRTSGFSQISGSSGLGRPPLPSHSSQANSLPTSRLSYGGDANRPVSRSSNRPPSALGERPSSRASDRPTSRGHETGSLRLNDRPISRGLDRPGSRGSVTERPTSRGLDRPSSRGVDRPSSRMEINRPSSRASNFSNTVRETAREHRQSLMNVAQNNPYANRPSSRASISGRATPSAPRMRPGSAMGSYHGYRESIDEDGLNGMTEDDSEYVADSQGAEQRTPLVSSRKSINAVTGGTGIPTPTPAAGRRQSGAMGSTLGKRSSRIGLKEEDGGGGGVESLRTGDMRPPSGLGVSSYRKKMASSGYGR